MAPQFMLLSYCITELVGMKTYKNLSRTDVVFTSLEMEEVEASLRTLLEADHRALMVERPLELLML